MICLLLNVTFRGTTNASKYVSNTPRHTGLASLLRPYSGPGRSQDAIEVGVTQEDAVRTPKIAQDASPRRPLNMFKVVAEVQRSVKAVIGTP
ncbi:hypothetical protein DPMN_122710 [Dreissena polymorpha]|uniref:Uncharacterized protein n=1 Tax=Dreissena polymorpha TaxID=45954 RepID=A0A9D4JUQ7_DREPO|nr:hypothetical protein DPMN_122710 [Dreissena polymorpha]